MSTTFEEAKVCPKCNKPGKDTATKSTAKRGVFVHIIQCETVLCPWYETTWLVQVNEDGSVPREYEQLGEKQYPLLSQESETAVEEAIKGLKNP